MASSDPRPKDRSELIAKYRKNTYKATLPIHPRKQRASLTSGVSTYSGEWGSQQVAHLLKRTLFGVKREELDQFKELTLEEAISTLLQKGDPPSAPVNDYNDDDITDPEIAFGETWIEAGYNSDYEGARIQSLKSWWLQNMKNQAATIEHRFSRQRMMRKNSAICSSDESQLFISEPLVFLVLIRF